MNKPLSAKELLNEHNQKLYREFTLNDNQTLSLPAASLVPWVGATHRLDLYQKIISHPGRPCHIKFITKNKEPDSFLWQTTTKQLKEATRWGIVKTRSITSQVIGSLGHYRMIAHKRVAKGMLSNSQTVKLRLLDLYQDRFEALQELESLVNKKISVRKYATALQHYVEKLEAISRGFNIYFSNIDEADLSEKTRFQIIEDLRRDIQRTKDYYTGMKDKCDLNAYSTARGKDSILEFVKQQMIHGLYEFQGINQDLTFDVQRGFSLTRGELNDCIEDARKCLDDHQADLWNAVTSKHHGYYSADPTELVTYDFRDDKLSPAREREVLLAISFIEGWDRLNDHFENESPSVSSRLGTQDLDVIRATRWKNHRNATSLIKSVCFYGINILKGFFVATKPWEEEAWDDPQFHLYATKLRKYARANEPLWQKPFKFFKQVFYAILDVFNGVRNFGAHLTFHMPSQIVNDWESSKILVPLNQTLEEVTDEIYSVKDEEEQTLKRILLLSGYEADPLVTQSTSKLARVEYELTSGERNDILTSIARGLNGFSSIFADIYVKDPIAGFVFTLAYATGAGAIYLPEYTASIFGSQYVEWFSNFSYSLGSSKFGAAIAGGSTQAQAFATAWDSVEHGPSGQLASAAYQVGEDPLTFSSYFAAAYGLGYVLANGVGGHPIPWLSHILIEDLGTVPEAGYPLVGAKMGILAYEGFVKEKHVHEPLHLSATVEEQDIQENVVLDAKRKRTIDRFRLALWLATHSHDLPKLDSKSLFAVSRQIDALFTHEESRSLYKLLYPDPNFSIAFQIFHMPLSYIPAILRVAGTCVLTVAAFFQGNPKPLEPLKRSFTALVNKTEKDLTRLIVFASYMMYLPYLFASTMVKTAAYLCTMTIGRVAGIFSWKPGHFFHQIFAGLHNSARTVTEYFYPTNILKSVEVAHPNSTMKEVEESYVKLMEKIGRDEAEDKEAIPNELAVETGITAPFIFAKKNSSRSLFTNTFAGESAPCDNQSTTLG
jgi:hypothetical protein